MKHNDLPERWMERLKVYLREELHVERGALSASDFRYKVKISFEDGSFAFFDYAFYILAVEWNEVAVFTEHCGYHTFPAEGTSFELLESK